MNLLIYQNSKVLTVLGLKGFDKVFSSLLPLGTLPSDAYYTFHCLFMFLFQKYSYSF